MARRHFFVSAQYAEKLAELVRKKLIQIEDDGDITFEVSFDESKAGELKEELELLDAYDRLITGNMNSPEFQDVRQFRANATLVVTMFGKEMVQEEMSEDAALLLPRITDPQNKHLMTYNGHAFIGDNKKMKRRLNRSEIDLVMREAEIIWAKKKLCGEDLPPFESHFSISEELE